MIEDVKRFDGELLIYLNNLGSENWDGFWLFVTDKWGFIPLYVTALTLSIYYKKWRGTLFLILFVLTSILISDQLSNLFKYGFERLRPCHDTISERLRLFRCGGKYGFFSAHASNSFATAVGLSLLLKRHLKYIFWGFIPWAMLVSYSRIYIGVHYPADVLVGAIIGTCIAVGLYLITKKIWGKYV